jgi:hypothetical protein
VRVHVAAIATLVTAACSSAAGPQGTSDAGAPLDSSTSEAGAGDTWTNWAEGFFSTYCVECHSASDTTGRNFTSKSVVAANAANIRCGVCNAQAPAWACPASPQARQFPIADATNTNPKPTTAERDRVVAWLSAGCP